MTMIQPGIRSAHRASVGGVVLTVLGVLLALLGGSLLAGGIAATVSDRDGYLTSPTSLFTTDTAAITTPSTRELTGGSVPQLPFELGSVRIRVDGDRPLFVGVAARADVDRYLDGVRHVEVTDVQYRPFQVRYRDVPGTAAPESPTAQPFWVASASGSGPREVTWALRPGDWAVVVMNEDGGPGVAARVRAGFHSDLLTPVVAGVAGVGGLLFAVGVTLLLLGTAAVGRTLQDDLDAAAREGGLPVRITGRAGEPLSRGLWLVKWLLVIPHYLLLAGLWIAFSITTIASGIAVLATGRYPKAWFAFDVGVLRWSWRVGFYAYSALGTDRYPPFTLATTDYPADLQVVRPDRLSRRLVLVKSWLLALPHLLVLAALAGTVRGLGAWQPWWGTDASGFSVLGALVLVAGAVLLFTGRYPRGLFDLVLGIDRWVYRVAVYVALLRDEYPPFRLDQGPDDPPLVPSDRPLEPATAG